MARRRVQGPSVDEGVPPELADPDHPVWTSREAVDVFVAHHDLDAHFSHAPPSMLRDPDFERFKAARHAWAKKVGMVDGNGSLDLHRLRDAGVFHGSRGPRLRGEHGTVDLGARRLIVD